MIHMCTGEMCTVKIKDTNVDYLFVTWLVFMLILFGILSSTVSDLTGISQSLLLLLIGLAIGIFVSFSTTFGDNIDPKTVLWILLPALLFESGIDTD